MSRASDPPAIGQRFRILGGDGDQHFFSNAGIMRLTEADWFPGRVGEFGRAILFVIETGPFAGEYIALTSRVRMSLEDQIVRHGHVSAVVHRISNPAATFDGGAKDSLAIGMAAVDRIS